MFDVLIIGGGVSGMSCALILGSGLSKPYAENKKVGIITHQKSSALQDGLYNNAYGIPAGTLGADLLKDSITQLSVLYPEVVQIPNEKAMSVSGSYPEFTVTTNKSSYKARNIVLAISSSNTFAIEGLMEFVVPHKKAIVEKNRIQLRNDDHKVAQGIYVCGTLAGWRSQLSIAAGSGAAVATDILTEWNEGKQTQVHDSIRNH